MPKTTSQTGIDFIKSFEACKLTAYTCQSGVLTIGYGHTSGVKAGMKITQEQADKFFQEDLAKFEAYVNNSSYVPFTDKLTQGQFDALVSFAYNCGGGNLKQLCSNRTIDKVGDDLVLYNKANNTVSKGLVRRRAAEQAMYKGNDKKDSLDGIAKEVLQGKWGNGEERKRRLTAAGYDYAAVQRRVTEML